MSYSRKNVLRRVANRSHTGAREAELTAIHLLTHPELIAGYWVEKRYAELACLADYMKTGVPLSLAQTDRALFRTLRKAETELHILGFGHMNASVLHRLANKKKA